MRKKKFLSLLLTFAMMMCLMPMKIFSADSVNLKITSDKAEAHPGDTITYTVKMGPIANCSSFGFKLVIPEGLTYVNLSDDELDALEDNIKGASGCFGRQRSATVDYNQNTLTLGVMGLDYTETASAEKNIMTFKCTVADDATGSKEVTFDSNNTAIADTAAIPSEYTLNLTGATVNITAAPIDPSGVSLDKHELNVDTQTGDQTLTATIAPPGATGTLVWSIEQTDNVATVTDNNDNTATVTINGVGTANITVTIQGTEYSDICVIHVAKYVCPHTNKTETAAKDATCTEPGNHKYYYCNDCQKYFKDDNGAVGAETTPEAETIPALEHNWGEFQYDGEDTHSRTCTRPNCGHKETEAHTFGAVTYEWSDDNSKCTAKHTCTVCGGEVTETKNTTSSLTKDPKCTEEGVRTYTATFTKPGFTDNNPTKTAPVGSLGHDLVVSYEWSPDNSTCTATKKCQRDGCGHIEVEETVDAAETTTATCTMAGERTYTATFTNAAFEVQTKEVDDKALGHDFVWVVTQEVTDTEDGLMRTVCSRCGEEGEEKVVPALNKDETSQLEASVPMDEQNVKLILQDPYRTLQNGTKLVVNLAKPGSERHNELSSQYDGTYNVENIAFFDINLLDLYDNKLPMPLPLRVRALLQIPEGWDKEDLEAVLIASDADVEFEESVVTIDGVDYLAFWTDHFSPYAMIDKLTDEEAAELAAKAEAEKVANGKSGSGRRFKTGESLNEVYFAGLLLSAAILALYLSLKKRREA